MSRSFRFEPPEPRTNALTRPRLLRSLVGRWHHRVTAVTGGPGLGKTTLLAQALAENRLSPRGEDVWIGVEANDADADRLARVVATAVADARPGTSQRVDHQARVDPAVVADAVWQRSPSEACLVLDDVHLLPPDSTGAAWLSGLVDALPANGHLVLASRSEPPVPLARFATQGAVLRLAEEDLRFSDEELVGFAAERGLDPARFADTGGWPAMAELAATVGQRQTGTYLWEEILEPLGTLRRHILAVLCDLGGADNDLATAAVGTTVDLASALAGVPLVAQGSDGWYVAHGLWRRAPGLALEPAERMETRGRAARHLTGRGRFDDAFSLVQETGQWDVAPTILRAACLAADRLAARQLGRWLAVSPDPVRASPAGQLAAGIHAAFTAPEDARRLIEQAAEQCRADEDIDAEVAAVGQLGRLAWWRQDLTALMAAGARVVELEATGHPTVQALATFSRAMLADLMGDDQAVLAELAKIPSGLLDPAWEVMANGLYGSVRLDLGDADATYEIVERLAPVADPVLRAVLEALRLGARWADGHVEEVLEGILAAEPAVRATGVNYLFYMGLTGAALAFSHVGQAERARQFLQEAKTVAPRLTVAPSTVRTAICTASLRLVDGDETEAAAALSEAITLYHLNRGTDRKMWRQNLALSYILVPESRAHWDSQTLRGHLAVARSLASAVVEIRKGGAAGVRDIELPELGLIRTSLHVRFAAELAAALAEVGRPEGPALVDALGPAGREALRSLAHRGGRPAKQARSLLAAVPAPPRQTTFLAVLGPLALHRGEGPHGDPVVSPLLRRTRLQQLVAFLVGHRHTSRGAVAAALWPDLDDRAAANNLGVTLNHLLRLLEPWRDSGEPAYLLRLDGAAVHLVTGEHLRVDVDEFDGHLAAAAIAESDGVPSLALQHDLSAIELYQGDLCQDVQEADWLLLDREHYRTRFVATAVRAGQLLLGRGDVDTAQAVAHRALDIDQWSEDGYAVLIGCALARGDRSGARRMLRHCLTAVSDLGAAPSTATQQLRRRVEGLVA